MMIADENRTETYLRFSRRSVFLVLAMTLAAGSTFVATALWPDGAFSHWMGSAFAVMPVILATLFLTAMRKRGFHPGAPEVKAVRDDEWRQANMDRALRVAFVVVLLAQLPLAVCFAHLPTTRALFGLGGSTMALGIAVLASAFLFYDRD